MDDAMRTVIRAVTLCAALLAGAAGYAGAEADGANHRWVNGMDVYLGVASVAAVRALPDYEKVEKSMHRGAAKGQGSYHLNVTLLDAASRVPIGDARVRASVREPGLAPQTKIMEPMTINGRAGYGNYFRMAGDHAYWIDVSIERPGMPTARTRFQQRIY
jgi:hypothetical protein